jgi:hypothetical protein
MGLCVAPPGQPAWPTFVTRALIYLNDGYAPVPQRAACSAC